MLLGTEESGISTNLEFNEKRRRREKKGSQFILLFIAHIGFPPPLFHKEFRLAFSLHPVDDDDDHFYYNNYYYQDLSGTYV